MAPVGMLTTSLPSSRAGVKTRSDTDTSVDVIATVTFRSSFAARLSFRPTSALLPSMPTSDTAKLTETV